MMLRRCVPLLLMLLAGHAVPVNAQAPVVLVLGDSLSAGYGLAREAGWVSLLQERLVEQGLPHQVVNASITGETTAGGLRRLPELLARHQPDLVLIELGANDGLRALPLDQMRRNLADMIRLARKAGAQPVLFAMQIPPNYGPRYSEDFRRVFTALAREHDVPLVPFFLERFALDPDYFQDDATHPNAKAQPLMLEAAWPRLQPLLRRGVKPAAAAPRPAG